MIKLRSLDRRILRNWVPLAFVATILIGFTYSIVQQDLRQGANDPQIQIAEDATSKLATGASTTDLLAFQQVDITSSLATFMTIFDSNGKVIATSGKLGIADPALPRGVFAYTKTHTEDRFTWQPVANIREAVVVRAYQTPTGTIGYVLVGRSLREVEKRVSELFIASAIAWAITLGGSLGLRLVLTTKK